MKKIAVRIQKTERGASTVGIALAVGIVVLGIGLAVLMSTDNQIRLSFFDLKRMDADWAIRSSIKLVEEAWKRYIGIERVSATKFQGTVYEDVEKYSRDTGLINAISLAASNNNPNYSLLVLLYETLNTSVDPKTITMPKSLIYQVDLIRDKPGYPNFQTNLDASDGIVFVAYQNNDGSLTVVNSVDNPDKDNDYDIIWNNLDNNGDRQFNAIITVTANGTPHYSSDYVFLIFPVKFEIDLTVRVKSGDNTVQKTVKGLGSCSLYLYRRSFAEYLVFSDIFTTESGDYIKIPKGFTYVGPVHTNTRFAFTGDPQGAVFKDYVTQVYQKAMFNGVEEPDVDLNRISYNNCSPTFEKGFAKGVAPIPAPTTTDLGDIPSAIRAEAPAPTSNGVYLRTTGNTWNTGDTLEKGGIYIKGDVNSITLSQGDQEQSYVISQLSRGSTTKPTYYYYDTSDCTGTEYTTLTTKRRSMKIIRSTPVSGGYIYTIVSDYKNKRTNWKKEYYNSYTEVRTEKYRRDNAYSSWVLYSTQITPNPLIPSSVENNTYFGLIDVVKADEGTPETPQVAIYIDGKLGQGAAGIDNIPTGLSGVLDKETELTICVKDSVVIAGDTIYERSDVDGKDPNDPVSPRLDKQGILGIISMTGKVYIDYLNPVGKPVYIDASLVAVNDSTDTSKRGVLTAYDWAQSLNAPYINLYGGVIQKYYGAVGSGDNGYDRNFEYDPRLRTSPPPLYPKQSACRMQLEEDPEERTTLQLAWSY